MVRPAELIQHQDMLHRLTGDQTGQPLAIVQNGQMMYLVLPEPVDGN